MKLNCNENFQIELGFSLGWERRESVDERGLKKEKEMLGFRNRMEKIFNKK